MKPAHITFLLLALAATGCVTSRQRATQSDFDARLESQERRLDRLERMAEELALKANGGVYVVRSGDSAATLARTFGTTTSELRTLNPSVDWTRLRVGQAIKVR